MKMKSFILLVTGFLSTQISGQSDPNEFSGETEGVRSVVRSEKLSIMPESHDSIIEIPPVKYYLEPAGYEVSFSTKPISPARLKVVEPLEKLYSGYIKAGLGSYTMPYVEAYYNSTRSKKSSWGVDVLHHSALGNIKDVGVNKFNDNHFGGFYKHFFKQYNWLTSLNFDRNSYHNYGFDANDTTISEAYRNNEDTIQQVYNLLSFATTLKSTLKDSARIHHRVDFKYNFLSNKFKLEEHNVIVGGNMFKYLNKEEVGADISLDINALNQPNLLLLGDTGVVAKGATYANAIFQLNPYIYSRGKNWSVRAGLNLQGEIGDVSKFRFYPNVEANYSMFNNILIPYVGLSGATKRNTFNKLRLENPYVLENSTLLNTNLKLKVFGGIRGSVSSKIAFNLSAGHEILEGLPLFVIDTMYSFENRFNVVYDSLSRTTIKGQLSYQQLDKFKAFVKGEYFAYTLSGQDFAWHMPDWKLTLSGHYNLMDKILVKANIFMIGARKTFSYDPVDDIAITGDKYIYTLKPFVDANLGFEYRYTKKLSAFLNFNNIVSKKYQRWSNYPVYSFNVLGGVTYSF